jgi:ATP-binding cassette subfamily A (ABC1) protein 2
MSVALASPQFIELPELILSPSQYYNLTQPRGNSIPFANNFLDLKELRYIIDYSASFG